MTFCWKSLDNSIKSCEVLTQWKFSPLGPTLIYKTSNLNNLRNCLEANQCIDGDRCNHKNRHSCHNLSQSCVGIKSVFPVWIRPTVKFYSLLMKSSRINELWSNKYDTHKSKIKKRSLERRTWKRFFRSSKLKLQRKISDE